MKASELRKLSAQELQQELLETSRELFSLRIRKGTDQLSQTHLLTKVRRDIARLKTILAEKKGED